jgi:hypothetical protein
MNTAVLPAISAVAGAALFSLFADVASRREGEKPLKVSDTEPRWDVFKLLNFLSIFLFVFATAFVFAPRFDPGLKQVVVETAGLDRLGAYMVGALSLAYMFCFFGVNFVSGLIQAEPFEQSSGANNGVVLRLSQSFTDLAQAAVSVSAKALSPPQALNRPLLSPVEHVPSLQNEKSTSKLQEMDVATVFTEEDVEPVSFENLDEPAQSMEEESAVLVSAEEVDEQEFSEDACEPVVMEETDEPVVVQEATDEDVAAEKTARVPECAEETTNECVEEATKQQSPSVVAVSPGSVSPIAVSKHPSLVVDQPRSLSARSPSVSPRARDRRAAPGNTVAHVACHCPPVARTHGWTNTRAMMRLMIRSRRSDSAYRMNKMNKMKHGTSGSTDFAVKETAGKEVAVKGIADTGVADMGVAVKIAVKDVEGSDDAKGAQPKQLAGDQADWAQVDKSKYFGKGAMLLAASQAVLYPLDLVKTRMQMQRQLGEGAVGQRPSASGVLKELYQKEGVSGIFRGFSPAMIGVVAGQMYMMSLETAKAALHNRRRSADLLEATSTASTNGRQQRAGAGNSSTMDAALAGMVATVTKELISTPANIISLRMQTHGMDLAASGASASAGASAGRVPPSMVAVAVDLVRADGVFGGLYRGFWLQLSTAIPTHALFWASHQAINNKLTHCWHQLPLYSLKLPSFISGGSSAGPNAKGAVGSVGSVGPGSAADEVPTMAISGMSAFLGATFAIACTTPVDVLKTHIQVEGKQGGGVRQTLQRLLADGGVSSLWKGFGPRCLKYAPLASVVVVYFDHAKKSSVTAGQVQGTKHEV